MTIDSDTQLAYLDAMWSDFKSPEPPPRLAHYTSLETLERILTTKELWLSNPLYMNDWEELRFGMQEGALAFRNSDRLRSVFSDGERYEFLVTYFNDLFSDFESDHALDVYVLCLSAHDQHDTDGVLSMWRGYGGHGTGAALILDTTVFPRYENLPLVGSNVVYASQQERREWLAHKVTLLAEVIGAHPITDDNMRAAAHYWFERLKLFSIFTKHCGFREEQEWRVVYMKQRDQKELLTDCLTYAVSRRGVEPKLKLSFSAIARAAQTPSRGEELLHSILLGPSQSSQLSQASVRRMVQILGFPQLAEHIVASGIPFRGNAPGAGGSAA